MKRLTELNSFNTCFPSEGEYPEILLDYGNIYGGFPGYYMISILPSAEVGTFTFAKGTQTDYPLLCLLFNNEKAN